MGIENPVHLLFIGAVALVVLGPKRLPGLAKALGDGIKEFRESIAGAASGTDPVDPSPPVDRAQAVDPAEPPPSEDAPS